MPTATQSDHSALSNQRFDDTGPGTILHDFETLLEFIGDEGLRATGKHHLLPIDCLKELDNRMSRPLRPELTRPQLRSFPVLQGLFVLLRASGIGIGQGQGKKTGRLCLDPQLLASWRTLNPTEQYFSLLEIWLLHGSFEIIGERGTCLQWFRELWSAMDAVRLTSSGKSKKHLLSYYGPRSECTQALMELFGFATFEPCVSPNPTDRSVEFDRTPFGVQLVHQIQPVLRRSWESAAASPSLGVLQPVLQRFFPEWKRSLEYPEPECRDGTFEFKVSWGDVWRRITIPSTSTVEELAQAILAAYRFDDDHLYEFRIRNRQGRQFSIGHPELEGDADYVTDEFPVGHLPLDPGRSMVFFFDFGDCWEFQVRLERIDPAPSRQKKARIVASQGKAPKQYDWDDE